MVILRGLRKNILKVWLDDFECKGEVDVFIPMLHRHEPFIGVNIPCIPHIWIWTFKSSWKKRQQNRSINPGSSKVRTWTFFDGFSSAAHPTIFFAMTSDSFYFDAMKPTQMVDVVHQSVVETSWMSLSPCRMAARSFVRRWWKDSDWALNANVEQKHVPD